MKDKQKLSFDRLVVGSKYNIVSLCKRNETIETEGTFKGYIYLGRDQALKMEMEEGDEGAKQIRVVPSHMILYLDIIEQKEEKKKKDNNRNSSYFG